MPRYVSYVHKYIYAYVQAYKIVCIAYRQAYWSTTHI